jgi:hypothetical protein
MDAHNFSFWFFLLRIVMGGIASFCAIFYLSKTRELAWIFIIVGTILFYAQILFDTLTSLEILRFDLFLFGINLFEIFSILMSNLPLLFFTIGFITIIIKHR